MHICVSLSSLWLLFSGNPSQANNRLSKPSAECDYVHLFGLFDCSPAGGTESR